MPAFFTLLFLAFQIQAAEPHTYNIINMKSNFQKFWVDAAHKPFSEQLKAWDEDVEQPHQGFYDTLVWSKKYDPKWSELKDRRLRDMFARYPKLYAGMIESFDRFDGTVKDQIQKFQIHFPDARFMGPIYAAPVATFNGKGGETGDAGYKGIVALAFGIDMIVAREDKPNVLYSHELFHIYHSSVMKLNEQVYIKEATMILPLWLEGLAVFVSGKFNPEENETSLLMDPALARLSKQNIQWLASEFLKIANLRAMDPQNQNLHLKWFEEGQETIKKGFPNRCGYRLGLEVARHLSSAYSLSEMSHWKMPEIKLRVETALKSIAAR